jgi:uncharacterized protein YaaW (UPF0174 family)
LGIRTPPHPESTIKGLQRLTVHCIGSLPQTAFISKVHTHNVRQNFYSIYNKENNYGDSRVSHCLIQKENTYKKFTTNQCSSIHMTRRDTFTSS